MDYSVTEWTNLLDYRGMKQAPFAFFLTMFKMLTAFREECFYRLLYLIGVKVFFFIFLSTVLIFL
jgi:hypothetical protein